jgi:hypothetical protein
MAMLAVMRATLVPRPRRRDEAEAGTAQSTILVVEEKCEHK